MLELIARTEAHSIQSKYIIRTVLDGLRPRSQEMEKAVMACWHDLLRAGVLAWGYNVDNPDPPFAHLTEHGRRLLNNFSRDPANPEGYLASLAPILAANPVARSY